MPGPEGRWADSAVSSSARIPRPVCRAQECGKGLDPEVGETSEKRATPPTICPTSSATPSVPRFTVSHTHPPLGERKSVSSSSPAPNIALAFARQPGGSRSVSWAFSRRRREMPRRRAALRQDELSQAQPRDRRARLWREVGQRPGRHARGVTSGFSSLQRRRNPRELRRPAQGLANEAGGGAGAGMGGLWQSWTRRAGH